MWVQTQLHSYICWMSKCTCMNSHFSSIFIDRRHGFILCSCNGVFAVADMFAMPFTHTHTHTHTKVTHVQKWACLTQNYPCFLFHFPLLERTSVFNKVKLVWVTGKSRSVCVPSIDPLSILTENVRLWK